MAGLLDRLIVGDKGKRGSKLTLRFLLLKTRRMAHGGSEMRSMGGRITVWHRRGRSSQMCRWLPHCSDCLMDAVELRLEQSSCLCPQGGNEAPLLWNTAEEAFGRGVRLNPKRWAAKCKNWDPIKYKRVQFRWQFIHSVLCGYNEILIPSWCPIMKSTCYIWQDYLKIHLFWHFKDYSEFCLVLTKEMNIFLSQSPMFVCSYM